VCNSRQLVGFYVSNKLYRQNSALTLDTSNELLDDRMIMTMRMMLIDVPLKIDTFQKEIPAPRARWPFYMSSSSIALGTKVVVGCTFYIKARATFD